MRKFVPERVLYEEGIFEYKFGHEMFNKFKSENIPMQKIKSHHDVAFVKQAPDENFTAIKKYIVLGVRKSLKLTPNNRSADFIVPFTSSGCSAMCTYCYLVCTFFKGSYLRLFVNRDEMVQAIKKKAEKIGEEKFYEIGSNSDMVLENTLTGNLRWAIENLSLINNVRVTFATKFSMVESILDAKHRGRVQMRISVNPQEIIKRVEIGTSNLKERIGAANKMYEAGYTIGINLAPIILIDNWQKLYRELFIFLTDYLHPEMKDKLFFELIFMTYGLANEKMNAAAMPNVTNVFNRDIMRPKGRGKYCYKEEIHCHAKEYFIGLINEYFPASTISYIV